MYRGKLDRTLIGKWCYQTFLTLLFIPVSQMLVLGCTTTYVVDKRDLARVSKLSHPHLSKQSNDNKSPSLGVALDQIALPVKRVDTGRIKYIQFDDLEVVAPSPHGGIIVEVTDYAPILFTIGGLYSLLGLLIFSVGSSLGDEPSYCHSDCEEDVDTGLSTDLMLLGGFSLALGAGLVVWGVAIIPGVNAPNPMGGWATTASAPNNAVKPGLSLNSKF